MADGWQVSCLRPAGAVTKARSVGLGNRAGWEIVPKQEPASGFVDVHTMRDPDGLEFVWWNWYILSEECQTNRNVRGSELELYEISA